MTERKQQETSTGPVPLDEINVGGVFLDAMGRTYTVVERDDSTVRIDHSEFGLRELTWHALMTVGIRPVDSGSNRAASEVVSFWDDVTRRWLAGDDTLDEQLQAWWESYSGRGDGAPTRDVFAEPYVGSFLRPRLVMLGLNPGRAVPRLQARGGVYSEAIRRTSYSTWAASDPYGGADWERVEGPNVYRRARLRFARRWLDDDQVQGRDLLTVELYPWHSRRVNAVIRPPDEVLDRFLWTPISSLPVEVIFAFGSPWASTLASIGLEPEDHLGRGGRDFGSSVASRTVQIYLLPSGQRLVVSWQAGYAGPPGAEDVARLRQEVAS